MRHPPLLLLALGWPAAAWFNNPRASRQDESWTPPRETSAAELQGQLALGWSPAPTQAPKALFGRMEIFPRQQDTVDASTCAYVSSDGRGYTCLEAGATCTYSDDYIGCCESGKNCNIVVTSCLDYAASKDGECDSMTDRHTVCCTGDKAPSCYTWLFSTEEGGDTSTLSYLECAYKAGTGTLLDEWPPSDRTGTDDITTTDDPETTTTTEESSTTDEPTSTAATSSVCPGASGDDCGNDDDGGGGGSSNVGAIAGGTVGGVAALGLVGLAAFLLLRHRRNSKNTGPSQPAMSQYNPQNPPAPSSSPGAGFQGYYPTQQKYDPHMSVYSNNSQGYPPQQYQPFPGPQGAYPQQQQQQQAYGGVAWQPSSAGSSPPPMYGNLSPGMTGQPPPSHQPSELQTISPLGDSTNRAEMG